MSGLLGWLVGVAWACDLSAPADAPFAVGIPNDAGSVVFVVVLRVDEASVPWARATLAVLQAHGLRAALSHRAAAPGPLTAALLADAREAGHDLIAHLEGTELPANPLSGPATLRKHLKPLTRVSGRLGAAEAPLGDAAREAVLHRMGLRAVLETNGPSSAVARAQQHLEAQPDVGVVLPAGPYGGPCGSSPVHTASSPATFDRATQAAWAAREANPGVVRLALTSTDPGQAAVLDRWLTEIVDPSGARVLPPSELRVLALRALKDPVAGRADPRATSGGRLVHADDVKGAADALKDARTIPRVLPGDLAPTEAFQAFLRVVAGREEGSVVRLGALDGPAQLASSTLAGPTPIPADQLRALAEALLDDLPERVPSAMPVGGHLLTASELLTALASHVRGEDPPIATPVAVSEPNAPGLGWGIATTP